jgi:hypothetical protein
MQTPELSQPTCFQTRQRDRSLKYAKLDVDRDHPEYDDPIRKCNACRNVACGDETVRVLRFLMPDVGMEDAEWL